MDYLYCLNCRKTIALEEFSFHSGHRLIEAIEPNFFFKTFIKIRLWIQKHIK